MSTAKTTQNTANAAKQTDEAVGTHHDAFAGIMAVGGAGASDAMNKALSTAIQGCEQVLHFGRANVEVLLKSNSIVVRGLQDLSQSMVVLAQSSMDDTVAAGKALAGARSMREMFDLSSAVLKSNLDKLVTESARLNQLSGKLSQEAWAPFNSHVEATMRKLAATAA